jgi:hypothetical protein
MHRFTLLLAIALVMVVDRSAAAGRTPFGWLYGTEVNPERMVESETWISEENLEGPAKSTETLIWWAPTIGITDRLEAAIPIEAARTADMATPPSTNIERWGAELRYRLTSPDPVDAGPVSALIRVGAKRIVDVRNGVRGEADVVVAYEAGRVLVSADLGFVSESTPDATAFQVRPAGGVSILTARHVRVGAEAYSELNVQGDSVSWGVVGPSASWTHGRFWLATALGIGVHAIHTAPRVKFGIQF